LSSVPTLKNLRRKITYSDHFTETVSVVASLFARLYFATLKIKVYHHPEFERRDKTKCIYGFWHGRQLLLIPFFAGWNVTIMTDLSWAGEIQARILKKHGYTIVRGSSKRKGVKALFAMKRAMENGHSAALALDGPSGPVHRCKPGFIYLALKSGYPVIPIACTAEKAVVLGNTWDKFLIPRPFSRCLIAFGKPVKVDDDVREKALDSILTLWQKKADETIGLTLLNG